MTGFIRERLSIKVSILYDEAGSCSRHRWAVQRSVQTSTVGLGLGLVQRFFNVGPIVVVGPVLRYDRRRCDP